MNENTKPQSAPSRAVTTPQPTRGSAKLVRDCKTVLEALNTADWGNAMAAALPKHMKDSVDSMTRTFISTVRSNELLEQADMRQVLGAFSTLAYLGLPPVPALGLAHIIPFRSQWNPIARKREEYINLNIVIGYPGYIELALRSGLVSNIKAGLVFPGDVFVYEEGSSKSFRHAPDIDHGRGGLTPRAAYACAYFSDGDYQVDVMPWADVMTVRNRSQAFRTALAAYDKALEEKKRPPMIWTEAPWVKDEHEMGRKSPVRRLAKYLPRCPDLRVAVEIEDRQDRSPVDYAPFAMTIDAEASPPGSLTPENLPNEDEYASGAALFGDRRPVENPTAGVKPRQTAAKTTTPRQTASPPPKEPDPPPPPEEPEGDPFEAILFDAMGEAGEEYSDAVRFAAAVIKLWEEAPDQEAVDALLEFNADAIDAAKSVDNAASMLACLDEPRDFGGSEPVTFTVIEPAMVRGQPSWPTWSKQIEDLLPSITDTDLLAWTEAQREMFAKAPPTSRVKAGRIIGTALAGARLTRPDWLSDMTKAAPAAAPRASSPPAASPAPANDATAPAATDDADTRWAKKMAAFIPTIGSMTQLIAETRSSDAVQKKMAQLKTNRPELYQLVFEAAGKRSKELAAAIPPSDDGDPGPETAR